MPNNFIHVKIFFKDFETKYGLDIKKMKATFSHSPETKFKYIFSWGLKFYIKVSSII